MAVTRADKAVELQHLASAFQRSDSAFLIDYKGLNVPQVTELRRQLRSAKASYKVVKNTLAKRAVKGTSFESLAERFQGTTAVAYTTSDPVALAKTLTTFAKTGKIAIKAALVQGRVIEAAEVTELATMPSRPELYAKLLFVLQAPLVQIVSVLNAAPRDLLSVLVQAAGKEDGSPRLSGWEPARTPVPMSGDANGRSDAAAGG